MPKPHDPVEIDVSDEEAADEQVSENAEESADE